MVEENRIRTRVILAYFSPSGTTLKTLNNIALGMGDVEISYIVVCHTGHPPFGQILTKTACPVKVSKEQTEHACADEQGNHRSNHRWD